MVGANDLCSELTIGAPWVGFYRSTDGGRTWSASLVPGYPRDRSKLGRISPTSKRCSAASDPTVGFDLHGKTAGIFGTGRIGRVAAQILRGFGMRVLA